MQQAQEKLKRKQKNSMREGQIDWNKNGKKKRDKTLNRQERQEETGKKGQLNWPVV